VCAEQDKPVFIALRRFIAPSSAKQKTLYLIRHGESKWNEAQSKWNVAELMGFDHPLDSIGVDQCQGLNRAWRSKESSGCLSDSERKFLGASMVFVSPLTRTVQTALLTLQGHPTMQQRGICLARSMREVKSTVGSLDTVGTESGKDAIKAKALCQLESVTDASVIDPVRDIEFDANDAHSHWWTEKNSHDDEASLDERFFDLMSTLQYTPEGTIICVGHSFFFREMMRRYLSKNSKCDPEIVEKLHKTKMGNAACLRVEIAFSSPPAIIDAEFMWGTGLEGDEHH